MLPTERDLAFSLKFRLLKVKYRLKSILNRNLWDEIEEITGFLVN